MLFSSDTSTRDTGIRAALVPLVEHQAEENEDAVSKSSKIQGWKDQKLGQGQDYRAEASTTAEACLGHSHPTADPKAEEGPGSVQPSDRQQAQRVRCGEPQGRGRAVVARRAAIGCPGHRSRASRHNQSVPVPQDNPTCRVRGAAGTSSRRR